MHKYAWNGDPWTSAMLTPTQIDTVPRGYLAIGAGGAIDASNARVGPRRTVPIEPEPKISVRHG
jgi:hypothetical protein